MKDANSRAYEDQDIVEFYVRDDLQIAEAAILEKHRLFLSHARMLDIGVGAGRTTHHFGPVVKTYLGVDFSPSMIAKCQEIFGNRYAFEILDIRDLYLWEANRFDFVLFSFNGLDNLSHQDRLTALAEIKRILAPDGLFCFSSHNMRSLKKLFHFRKSFNPFITWKRYRKHAKLVRLNGNLREIRRNPFAIIDDGAHEFRVKNYFIYPENQTEQLRAAGYADIAAYASNTGAELDLEGELCTAEDEWIYFTCRSSRQPAGVG